MLKNKMQKIVKKYNEAKTVAFYPWGLDSKFDDDCNKSFLKFLDFAYYAGLAIIFSIPLLSLITIGLQANG